jgi:hypothetical protein
MSKRKKLFRKSNYAKESYSNEELAVTSIFSDEGCTVYFRLSKELFGYVHAFMRSDILADGCNAQKPVDITEKLASLHVNHGDEIFALLGIYAA